MDVGNDERAGAGHGAGGYPDHRRRATNLISLTAVSVSVFAFVLSVVVAIPQLKPQWLDSILRLDVKFYPSNEVLFKKAKMGICKPPKEERDCEFVRLSSGMAYANISAFGYPDIVNQEVISMNFCPQDKQGCDKKLYKQRWETFESFFQNNGSLESFQRKPAVRKVINGRGVASHETYFTPLDDNHLPWSDFKDRIEKNNIEIEIKRTVEFLYSKTISTCCRVKVNGYMRRHLEDNPWYTATCKKNEEDCT